MKWTVNHTVLSGYLLLVILLAGTYVFVSVRTADLDRSVPEQQYNPRLEALRGLLEDLRAQQQARQAHLLAGASNASREEAEASRVHFLEGLAELEKPEWGPQDRALLSRARRLLASLDSSASEALQRASDQPLAGSAYQTYRREVEPLQIEVEGLLWQLMNAERRAGQLSAFRLLVGRSLATMVLLAVLLGVVAVIAIELRVNRPLRRLAQAARRLGEGQRGCQVNVPPEGDVRALAQAFNEMSLQVQRLDRFRSEFVSNVSHELRTPLVSIQQAVSLLADGVPGPLKDHQRDLLDIIRTNQQRLKKLIEQLLDLSRFEAQDLRLQFQKTDMLALAEECVRAMQPLAKQGGIRVNIEAPEKLSPIWVDQERIRQVLTNLLGNAAKFTPEGGRITVRLWEEQPELRCDVIDTGPGVPTDELEVIFDKFYQVRRQKGAKTEGTGLGLAISKAIVSAHNGRIWATSTLGEGATFSFSLPKLQSEQTLPEGKPSER